jgi:hypothetical protein
MALFTKNEVVNPHRILSHDYAITRGNELSVSTKRVLDKTVELMEKFPGARCLIFDSDYFWQPKEFINQLKKDYLATLGADFRRIDFGGGICTTIEEIDKANDLLDLKNLEVVSVCDKMHACRVRYIWKALTRDFQPKVNFKVVGIKGKWTNEMPSKWQRSSLNWLIANIVGYLAYVLQGVEKFKKFTHKVQPWGPAEF